MTMARVLYSLRGVAASKSEFRNASKSLGCFNLYERSSQELGKVVFAIVLLVFIHGPLLL